MKISDASKTPATEAARRPRASAASEKTVGAAASSAVYFRGVPEAELTPRVREALIGLIREVNALREELAGAKARITELEGLADTDPLLADVVNRRAFVRELGRVVSLVERYGTPASLIFADLDNLKVINDSHGHAAGDAALRHVASVIAENIRKTDTLGRLGGDEFGVILLQADQKVASEKARALADAIAARPVETNDGAFHTGVSYGVIEIKDGWSADKALETADRAMYAAKNGGKFGDL